MITNSIGNQLVFKASNNYGVKKRNIVKTNNNLNVPFFKGLPTPSEEIKLIKTIEDIASK